MSTRDPENNGSSFDRGPLNSVRAMRERGHYDAATVFGILDQAIVAHVGLVDAGRPIVIPMLFGRDGDRLFLHGARKGRVTSTAAGAPVCITVTLVDGIVVARSMFDASMNYRSVVIHGNARELDVDTERLHALRCISDHVLPGRWNEVRAPFDKELKGTSVLEVTIEAASAKIRHGPSNDDIGSGDERIWAGIVPMRTVMDAPIPDASVPHGVPLPQSLRRLTGHTD
jgi:nitroimidazol reductase NimA-like FMN-containing flavoprotein (pyridoxamine 5'-phosphate oxidase superfamily)